MPFEPAPKTEQQDRVQLGRIALGAIAAHVLTVPPEKFNITWFLAPCGTVGCAIGHSYALPEVVATGLRPKGASNRETIPAFGNETGMEAVAAALGLSYLAATEMFHPSRYQVAREKDVSRQMVSDRIREYLAA